MVIPESVPLSVVDEDNRLTILARVPLRQEGAPDDHAWPPRLYIFLGVYTCVYMMNRDIHTRCTRCDTRGMYYQKTSARHLMSQERCTRHDMRGMYHQKTSARHLMSQEAYRDSFMCDMTRSCATWLIHVRHDSLMCDVTHSCATWLIHMRPYSFMYDMSQFICDMTHSPAPATSEFSSRWRGILFG